MSFDKISDRGLVILGCGRMGGAILQGLLKGGLPAASVWVVDPNPSDWLKESGVNLNADLPANPAVVLVAVKPQMMADALPQLSAMAEGDTLFVTVAAGITIEGYEKMLGTQARLVRAMPNTPAAIGRGVTAIVGNPNATGDDLDTADALMTGVGQVVRLDDEEQMNAVIGVSGSGPAYVFHLIEVMAAAGEAEGLDPDLALRLAKATVGGAGQLAEDSDESPSKLRENVTSPGGTTAAALEVLMDPETGMPPLMRKAVAANIARNRELGK
ncbi:pyrroline-5-carboxylate reductase [Thioclava sp.]|uniref:pyrroline-5-carboxylate reductase n=1 Tax=Thioclava sp. TaxID=1933450 RepID=UPI003242BC85